MILLHLFDWGVIGDEAAHFSGSINGVGCDRQLEEVWSTEWQCLHQPSALMVILTVKVCV